MISAIPYQYRDAANYKEGSTIYLDGELSADDIALIESKLSEGDGFIPGNLAKVSVEELQPRMTSFPSDDDHVYHELELTGIRLLKQAPEGESVISARDFVDSFAAIAGPEQWDEAAAMERLGIE